MWGLRQRKTLPDVAAARPAGPSDVESVTVRPVAKPAPVAAAAAAAAAELPITPPAGQPAVPFAPPSAGPAGTEAAATETALAETAASGFPAPSGEAEVVAASPPEGAPDDAPAVIKPSPEPDDAPGAGLAELVAEDSPWPEDPDSPTTPSHGQPAVEGGEPWPADPTAPDHVATEAAPDLVAGAAVGGGPAAADDLKVVEGIGPRVEAILQESGIVTLSDLAEASPERLRTLLDLAGDQFRVHDPATWPEQAGLAAAGQWDQLATLQSTLTGGKET
jgi:predicted flap endonuclease-1-like 5' DNA nuclease